MGFKGLEILKLCLRTSHVKVKAVIMVKDCKNLGIKDHIKHFTRYKYSYEIEIGNLANKYSIPIYYYPFNGNDSYNLANLKTMRIDLGIVASFSKRLDQETINFPVNRVINLHSSILPIHRGNNPIFWTIRNGDREAGVTIHYVTEKFDQGDIILQKKILLR